MVTRNNPQNTPFSTVKKMSGSVPGRIRRAMRSTDSMFRRHKSGNPRAWTLILSDIGGLMGDGKSPYVKSSPTIFRKIGQYRRAINGTPKRSGGQGRGLVA